MGVAAVTPRLRVRIPYTPRRWARPFHASLARWSGLVLHRRAGKTTAVINHHQRAATDDASAPPEIILVQNWHEELKRLVPVN